MHNSKMYFLNFNPILLNFTFNLQNMQNEDAIYRKFSNINL